MRLDGVGRRYGRRGPWILRGVALAVEAGALVRIGGPNGSGKSTLLRIAAGVERPTEGTAELPAHRAYVPERFPPALPFDARDYLQHLGRIRGLDAAEAERRAEHWLDVFGIADRAGTPLAELSKGTCQKVAVAQALLADADLLVLDEAWTGLDPAARARLDEEAADRAARGGRVLFVDHDPARLAGLTTAAYEVSDGALLPADPGPADGPTVRIEVEPAGSDALPERLPGAPRRTVLPDGSVRLEVAGAHSDALLRALLGGGRGVHVRSLATVLEQTAGAAARAVPEEAR
ncbi:ATP-binding cassette domain-containing protein [Kitasatospora sp. DSM 101779]|uniref:ABC transporter ATP-binding protein n=1 Tax=Kitasatospora sp. DSM 101779 TaxID=2853165 RepID=UPI0021D860F0|nr:ATP-binding cassette domain-containing protein [Kitasatospora sp. DSM 101779]MCU7823186.1 ATP-binding cassette domain-containing protein [Kitasatospora sp. DSM 101779]